MRNGRCQKLRNVCISGILGPLKIGFDRLLETNAFRDLAYGDRGIRRELDCPESGLDFGSSRLNSLHCYLRVNCRPPPPPPTSTILCVYIEKHAGYSDCVKVFFAVVLHSVEDGQGFLSFRNLNTVIMCLYSYEVLGLG